MSFPRTYSRNSTKRKLSEAIDSDEDVPKWRRRTTPPTPSKIPRDLSQIFETASPAVSSSGSPGKLARRMLGRSKTESSIDSTSRSGNSTPSLARRTPSLPSILSPPKPTVPFPDLPPPQPRAPTKRTYAGKSRSFLVSLPVNSSANGLGLEDDDFLDRESYSSLRSRWGVDMSEDDLYPQPSQSQSHSDSDPATPTSSSPKRSKSKSRGKAYHNVLVPEPLPNGMMNPLKSITELRSKGENRRFLDEVGYLIEGMDKDGAVGLRRASALEIATKLCDSDFTRKAKAADFIGQTWDTFVDNGAGDGKDQILDLILAFFSALVARDDVSLADVAERSSSPSTSSVPTSYFATTLFAMLACLTPETDLLLIIAGSSPDIQLRKLGVKKNEQILLRSIHSTISSSSLFADGVAVSTSLLITHALAALPPSFLSTVHFASLLKSLRHHLDKPFPSTTTRYDKSIDFSSTHNILRLFDSFLLGQWAGPGYSSVQSRNLIEKARDDWLLNGLISCAVCTEIAMKSSKSGSNADVDDCLDMIFRVLVSLSHRDQDWCENVLAHPSAPLFIIRTIVRADRIRHERQGKAKTLNGKTNTEVKKEESDIELDDKENSEDDISQARVLDRLCLALGLFTNLVQEVEDAKDVLRDLLFDPSCTLTKPACLHKCCCRHPANALNLLARVYLHQVPISEDPKVKMERQPSPALGSDPLQSADASFLLGHLSVLFGLLMKGNEKNQTVILDGLCPTKTTRTVQLNSLVEHAADLAAFYAVIKGGEADGEGNKGEDVAKDVIRFLQDLRDKQK
ncbi:uncharacterized protein BT62DRAFT_933586 [Guyanagaster necrorhizus]|uniref:Wings apart-like protein C-terminal domain-containing protein n=1 Tax=Guyanagaster necrorhizus TaxID=856835 RepID=A0A9P7VQQ9_9AGAR|nr:uncharacterized protein BT62DRAFT_933586 [Guyanagaster necrorhizus MCA 3950]KAG7445164.1 hypothetical protein BT62DRAFT_933586 [Guyanagaster necrorhizus MCA 3950]